MNAENSTDCIFESSNSDKNLIQANMETMKLNDFNATTTMH